MQLHITYLTKYQIKMIEKAPELDFDTLMALAKKDPQEFALISKKATQYAIDSSNNPQRLKGLQFTLEQTSKLAKNSTNLCATAIDKMMQQLAKLHEIYQGKKSNNQHCAKILKFNSIKHSL